jgi:hypothetical protein
LVVAISTSQLAFWRLWTISMTAILGPPLTVAIEGIMCKTFILLRISAPLPSHKKLWINTGVNWNVRAQARG